MVFEATANVNNLVQFICEKHSSNALKSVAHTGRLDHNWYTTCRSLDVSHQNQSWKNLYQPRNYHVKVFINVVHTNKVFLSVIVLTVVFEVVLRIPATNTAVCRYVSLYLL